MRTSPPHVPAMMYLTPPAPPAAPHEMAEMACAGWPCRAELMGDSSPPCARAGWPSPPVEESAPTLDASTCHSTLTAPLALVSERSKLKLESVTRPHVVPVTAHKPSGVIAAAETVLERGKCESTEQSTPPRAVATSSMSVCPSLPHTTTAVSLCAHRTATGLAPRPKHSSSRRTISPELTLCTRTKPLALPETTSVPARSTSTQVTSLSWSKR
mmetsp:Transcript_11581/g.37143  ORF Transcript_11581/g.37143 Transcript_11581/m.37143 type:complete len:214 (+) Transcript_11581:382-1023(+)